MSVVLFLQDKLFPPRPQVPHCDGAMERTPHAESENLVRILALPENPRDFFCTSVSFRPDKWSPGSPSPRAAVTCEELDAKEAGAAGAPAWELGLCMRPGGHAEAGLTCRRGANEIWLLPGPCYGLSTWL